MHRPKKLAKNSYPDLPQLDGSALTPLSPTLTHRPNSYKHPPPVADAVATVISRPDEDDQRKQHPGGQQWSMARCAGVRSTAAGAAYHRRCTLTTAAVAALLTLAVLDGARLLRHAQDAFASLYYGLDPQMLGRSERAFPAPRCCADETCAAQRTGRVAAVTYIRSAAYLPLFRQLECTLRTSNPSLELAAMVVEGELPEDMLQSMRDLGVTILPVAPLDYANSYEPRYSRNWLKIRAFALTQYDALVLLDSDTAVARDLSPLFGLPVEFAAVWDQSKWLSRYKTELRQINGGVFFLRPCQAIADHMLSLLEAHPKLRFRFGTAEQDFFAWYFRYTAMTLPLQYNCQVEQSLEGNMTVGGAPPKILHFAGPKPRGGLGPSTPGFQFLCTPEQLEARQAGGGAHMATGQQEHGQQEAGVVTGRDSARGMGARSERAAAAAALVASTRRHMAQPGQQKQQQPVLQQPVLQQPVRQQPVRQQPVRQQPVRQQPQQQGTQKQ